MSQDKKNIIKRYSITVCIGILVSGLYLISRDFPVETLEDNLRILCDAFTVPGMLMILTGGLIAALNAGALDSVGYAGRFVMQAILPTAGLRKPESYYDYIQRKREKPVRKYGFLFIVGGVNMFFALIFLVLFYVL